MYFSLAEIMCRREETPRGSSIVVCRTDGLV